MRGGCPRSVHHHHCLPLAPIVPSPRPCPIPQTLQAHFRTKAPCAKKPCHALVAVDPRQWRQVGGKPLSSRNLFFWPRRSLLQLAFQPYSPPALIPQPLTCCWWNCISFAGAGVNSWSSGADKSCSCHGKRQKIRERRPILKPSRPHPGTL